MLLSAGIAIISLGSLIQFKVTIGSGGRKALPQGFHLVSGQRREAARDPQILLQDAERRHPADGRGNNGWPDEQRNHGWLRYFYFLDLYSA